MIYSIADIAINPMLNGSGTNLKIAEYMANGVPVISTKVGARGYDFENEHLVISELNGFVKMIDILSKDGQLKNDYIRNAYKYIVENFSWDLISLKIIDLFNDQN